MQTPSPEFRTLSDLELVADLKQLVQRERSITLAVLLRLVEVELRRIHRETDSSLFTYCVNQLGYSRSAACRRIQAARCLRDYPVVEEMLGDGRLNLTTIGLISRVLTRENSSSLLEQVAGRPEAEVARIAAAHGHGAPANLADRIRPIRNGRDHTGVGATQPSSGLEGPARHSSAGDASVQGVAAAEGPASHEGSTAAASIANTDRAAPSMDTDRGAKGASSTGASSAGASVPTTPSDSRNPGLPGTPTPMPGTRMPGTSIAGAELPANTAESTLPSSAGTSRSTPDANDWSSNNSTSFRIEFTATQSLVSKLGLVQALLSRGRPGVSVCAVFEACLDEYLEKHDPVQRDARRRARREKRKSRAEKPRKEAAPAATNDAGNVTTRAATNNAGNVTTHAATDSAGKLTAPQKTGSASRDAMPASSTRQSQRYQPPVGPSPSSSRAPSVSRHSPAETRSVSRQVPGAALSPSVPDSIRIPSRHIPAALRDLVWIRDSARCAFRGPDGTRCTETHGLEVDHIDPWALGGPTVLGNLRLMCGPHNQLHAERTLGSDFMKRKRQARTRPQAQEHTRDGHASSTRDSSRWASNSAGAG